MLAIERRAGMHLARCGRELHGKPERLDETEFRMLDLDDHFACERLRIGERLQHVANRTTGDALVLERLEPVFRWLGTESPAQFRLKLFQVSHAVGGRLET